LPCLAAVSLLPRHYLAIGAEKKEEQEEQEEEEGVEKKREKKKGREELN
jgi:hypothetical protein